MKGFSFVELLASLAILSIIAVFSLPSSGHIGENLRLKSAVRQLQTSLQLARSLAIRYGETISVCALQSVPRLDPLCTQNRTGEWQNGWIIFKDINNNRQHDKGEQILGKTEAHEQIRIRSSSQKSLVRISALGASILSNQTWEFCRRDAVPGTMSAFAYRLVLAGSGQTRLISRASCQQ